jgi:transcription elongation factor/antiterminator RfaH
MEEVAPAAVPAKSRGVWVAVTTHAGRETWATEHLHRQSYEVYCPMIRKQLRKGQRTYEVDRALFPNYLFVRTASETQAWRPLLSTRGVRNVVCFGSRLGTIDEQFISDLRAREVDGIVVNAVVPFEVGKSVRVISGPFAGLIAEIVSVDERDRLMILMTLMQRRVAVRVPVHSVTADLGAM